ncbi:MAG: cytochrome c [Bacteroidota bacterium]|nr:cytochrome c [Bacteroidota bacterium]
MKKIVIYITFLSLFFIGCSKTNEEAESKKSTTTPAGTASVCDTVNMKYALNIQPIIQANCYSCHANGVAESGVTLETYNQVKQKASSGLLLKVITHASGVPAMPYQRPKLSDCDINKIQDWIDRGYAQ